MDNATEAGKEMNGMSYDNIEEFKALMPKVKKFILNRDGPICQYCGVQVNEKTIATDHVVPETMGGITAIYNLVIACRSCNIRKMKQVWIPNNLEVISNTSYKAQAWGEKILSMAHGWQHVLMGHKPRDGQVYVPVNSQHLDFLSHHFPGLERATAMRIFLDIAMEKVTPADIENYKVRYASK